MYYCNPFYNDTAYIYESLFCILRKGHTRLHRIPFLDREETRKKERLERQETKKKKAVTDEEVDESICKNSVTWVKYSLGVKHSVC